MSKLILIFSLSLWLLVGCASSFFKQFDGDQLKLLPPSTGPETQLLKQKMTLHSLQGEQSFIAVTRLSLSHIKLAVLLPTGQPFLAIHYDGQQLIVDNKTQIDLPAQALLAMVQFVLWSEAELERAYPIDEGWHLKFNAAQRQLMRHGKAWLAVRYDGQTVTIKNTQRDVTIFISPLETSTVE